MDEDRKHNFKMMVKHFSDEDVLTLHSLCFSEVQARIQKKVDNGNFPELNENEKILITNGQTISAIQDYRSRTGIDDLMVARKIVENYKFGKK